MDGNIFSGIKDAATPPAYRYYDGQRWTLSASGRSIPIISPVDGTSIGSVAAITREEADAAIARAVHAQPAWEAVPLNRRVKIMHLAADWMRHYEKELTDLLIAEIGKTRPEAQGEVVRTANLTDYFADEVLSLRGESLESDNFPGYDKGKIALIDRVAHGVILCIAPFNYPMNLAASKIVPALLMGNAVIFKPPTQGAISGLHLTAAFVAAGIPPGIISTLTGGGSELGNMLVSDPKFNMIAFTGSTETGTAIAKQTSMIPLLFECGGNNPAIVLPDADVSAASREIIKGSFSYAGQRCTGIKYVLSTQGVLDKLIPLVLSDMKTMITTGNPNDDHTKLVGPVISESAAQDILAAVTASVNAGATLLTGGTRNGTYVEPTVLTGVTAGMPCVAKEVFGPVLSFIAVSGFDEAVAVVNSSVYGLQASVFTRDEGSGMAIAKRLAVGTVQINGSPQRGPDHFPFLGIKRSGVGVQGVRYSLEAMSRLRSVVINTPA